MRVSEVRIEFRQSCLSFAFRKSGALQVHRPGLRSDGIVYKPSKLPEPDPTRSHLEKFMIYVLLIFNLTLIKEYPGVSNGFDDIRARIKGLLPCFSQRYFVVLLDDSLNDFDGIFSLQKKESRFSISELSPEF